MCGICGIVPSDHRAPVDEDVLQTMADSLGHRGPDGAGYYVTGAVGLGHRRLSIIDLDGGDQPIANEDGSAVIVFNGEVYNYKELRAELQRRGHRFSTESDTEVIVHLYEDEGVDCVDSLNGMFAFAIWDSKKKLLFAARDRMGEKPFYYTLANGALVFGSELKALRKHPNVCARFSLRALDDYLAYGYVPAPRTIYEGIFKLPAAHRLVWDSDALRVDRYWSPRVERVDAALTEEEAVDSLRELLRDSIRLRLRSDVPVGAFLSGGIDSSLVVALSSLEAVTELATFSVRFDEFGFDESPYARRVAKQFGTRHHEIVVRDADLGILPKLVAQFDEPFADPSSLPTYFITREASRNLKVCLSGDAGDELFGGYDRYAWEPAEREISRIPAGVRRETLGRLATLLPDSVKGKGWLRRMAETGAVQYQRKNGVFDASEREALFRPEFRSIVDHTAWYFQPHFNETAPDVRERRMAADQETYLPEDILVKVDRDSMLNSLEVRVPLLDHRIVKFANSLPLILKIRGVSQKHILKELLRSLLSDDIVERPKHGFGLPLARWFRDRYAGELRHMLLSRESRLLKYIDYRAIERLIGIHQRGRRDFAARLWSLLWLEHWFRVFGV